MKLERISLELGDRQLAFDVHPRLTVLTGVPADKRPRLATELLRSLGHAGAGNHAEVVLDSGSHVAIFRPVGVAPMVVDIDTATDLTAQHRLPSGEVILSAEAIRLQRLLFAEADDLRAADPRSLWTNRLAAANQSTLWDTATRLQAAELEFIDATDKIGATVDRTQAIEEVEAERAMVDAAEERHRRTQHLTLAAGTVLPLVAGVGYIRYGLPAWPAGVMIGSSFGITGLCWIYERRLRKAILGEREALHQAGVKTYAELHAQTADTALGDADSRARLLQASQDYRAATLEWSAFADDVPASWALTNRNPIEHAAAVHNGIKDRVRLDDPATDAASSTMVAALIERLGLIRQHIGTGEALPLIIDDAFEGLTKTAKASMLEMLGDLSADQQIVLMSDDPEIVSWANVESMTGDLSLVDPNPAPVAPAPQPIDLRAVPDQLAG